MYNRIQEIDSLIKMIGKKTDSKANCDITMEDIRPKPAGFGPFQAKDIDYTETLQKLEEEKASHETRMIQHNDWLGIVASHNDPNWKKPETDLEPA